MMARILYATARLEGYSPDARVARRLQSAAARDLLASLQNQLPGNTAQSKSHSRAIAAAAAGNISGLALGIDVEWRDPSRQFTELAGLFFDAGPHQTAMEEFYRLWTFGEAYFKAFQRLPTETQIRYVRDLGVLAEQTQLPDGTCFFGHLLEDNYQLSIVWRSESKEPCILDYISEY